MLSWKHGPNRWGSLCYLSQQNRWWMCDYKVTCTRIMKFSVSIVTTGTPSQTFWRCEERVKVAYVCGAIVWATKDLAEELRQPRLQGFSLSQWEEREKALASAGHVCGVNISWNVVFQNKRREKQRLFFQPIPFPKGKVQQTTEVGAAKPCGEWNASYGRWSRKDRCFAAKTLARAKTIPPACYTRLESKWR